MATPTEGRPRDDPAGAGTPDAPRSGPPRHLRQFYVIRTVTAFAGLAIAAVHLAETGAFTRYHVLVFLFALAYPHLAYVLATRLEAGRTVEHATLVLDAFVCGSIVHFVDFAMLPGLTVAMIALLNPVAFAGVWMVPGPALALGLGIAVPAWLSGTVFAPAGLPVVNVMAAVYLLAYYGMFAYAVFARTNALQRSRRELRQQKAIVEIEKKRSDMLLLGILPDVVAREFERGATVAPRRHARAALLAVAFPGLSAAAERMAPAEFFGELNQLFKALDAIGARHGLESLKTVGHRYNAAAGLGADVDAAAAVVRAAQETQRFLDSHNVSRRARGLSALDYQVAAHAGPVVAGVVETRRFSYDLFGEALTDVDEILRRAPLGLIVVSAAVRDGAGTIVAGEALGDLPSASGGKIALYAVSAQPAGV